MCIPSFGFAYIHDWIVYVGLYSSLANELDSYWLLSGGLDSQLVGGFLVGELVSPCTGGGARVDGTGPYVYHNAASIYSTVLAQYVFFHYAQICHRSHVRNKFPTGCANAPPAVRCIFSRVVPYGQ